jgi:hypothetical protein
MCVSGGEGRKGCQRSKGYGEGGSAQGRWPVVNLVVALCYDQKPFYMILSRCKSVTWTPIRKKLWSTSLQWKVDFTFLRWSMSNDYNFQMNDNDIADQL